MLVTTTAPANKQFYLRKLDRQNVLRTIVQKHFNIPTTSTEVFVGAILNVT